MEYTLKHAKDQLAQYAGSGLCADDPRFVVQLDKAIRILMTKAPWWCVTKMMRLCSAGGCLVLPPFVKKVYRLSANGCRGYVFDKWYEFLDGGPGYRGAEPDFGADLIDRGNSPVFRQPKPGHRILVLCDKAEASDASITIRGYDRSGREVFSESNLPGEMISIVKNSPRYSASEFGRITSVVKPETKGMVYLNSYNPSTQERILLASYGPRETNPSFKVYAVSDSLCSGCESIVALVKMAHVPLKYDTDPLLIQSLDALQFMLTALKFYDAQDADGGVKYESMAIGRLEEESGDNSSDVSPINISGDFGFSTMPVIN